MKAICGAFWSRIARTGALLTAASAVLACAGCIGPTYHRPQLALPSQWGTQVAPSQRAWPSADWWHLFGSSTLEHYLAQAQSAGDDIAAAVARIDEAVAQARIAGAPLYPAVSASAEALRVRSFLPGGGQVRPSAGGGAGGANGSGVIYTEFTPQVSASYVLDFWGKNRAAHAAALLQAQASRYDRQTVTLTVTSNVAQSYFQALETHDLLQVAQNNLSNAQHILDGLQLEQQVGTVTALDVAQQAAVVGAVNASIPPLVQQLHVSMDALAVLLGELPETLPLPDSGLDQVKLPPVIEGLPSQLLERRPDIAEAEAQLQAANANITVARAAFFPNVALTASGGYASSMLSDLLVPSARVFQLTGTVAQDIFQGGALRGQAQYAHARYAELLATYHKAVIAALSDVENALIGAQQTDEQQRRQQVATDQARRAFDFAQEQMAAGTTNILTVLNTETTLFTAEDQLVVVKFQHLQALLQLYQALGGGWQAAQESL
jgi:NodT family efflux transporter outer membrane factor (OMF) lipoprotein